ncbi:OmpA family protein [Megalodesulfovibrio paquesii]
MKGSTVATLLAAAGVLAALVLGVLLFQERQTRRNSETTLADTSRKLAAALADSSTRTAEMHQALEQERALRSAQGRECDAAQQEQARQTAALETMTAEARALRQERDTCAQERDACAQARESCRQELEAALHNATMLQEAAAGLAGTHQTTLSLAAASQSALQELGTRLEQDRSQRQQLTGALATVQRELQARLADDQHAQKQDAAGAPQTQVEIQEQEDGVRITILGEVLFSSGSRRLRPEGRALLTKMAAGLKNVPDDAVIQVIGHADDRPIMAHRRWLVSSNLELSAARAAAVAELLPREAGLDPARFYAMGRAAYDPVAGNETPEGRARNRRVVIRIVHASQALDVLRAASPHAQEQAPGADNSTDTGTEKNG